MIVAACGAERDGDAIPDGEAVSNYVGTKFEGTMEGLTDDILAHEDRKFQVDSYLRLNDQWLDATIEAATMGTPPDRIAVNRDNKSPADQRISFVPVGSDHEYVQLSGLYSELADTPWVKRPVSVDLDQYSACLWSGMRDACKMQRPCSRWPRTTAVH